MEEVRINNTKTDIPASSDGPRKNKSLFGEIFSVLGILILAPVIAIILTFFVFQSYVVDGPSMEDTLHHQDRLIVWKAPKTFARITNKDFIPSRYSIIIFKQNSGTVGSEIADKQLVKRVVGLPGDRVVISNGSVTIYNDERKDGFYPDREISGSTPLGSTEGETDYTVKPGEVFVLGDNRDNSLDSRVFGAIKSEDIIGTLAVRIYPFDKIQKF